MDNKKLTNEMTTKIFEMTLREGDTMVTYEVTISFAVSTSVNQTEDVKSVSNK